VKPRTIDEYLATLSAGKRAALQKLRRAIKSAAPEAEERISYQLPAFRFRGRILVWFGAATNHCSFYPGAHPIKGLEAPLPATLVRKLVKVRISEQAATKRRA